MPQARMYSYFRVGIWCIRRSCDCCMQPDVQLQQPTESSGQVEIFEFMQDSTQCGQPEPNPLHVSCLHFCTADRKEQSVGSPATPK